MATLDRKSPYAKLISLAPQSACFEQDGVLFDQAGKEVGKVPGYEEQVKRKVKPKRKKETAAVNRAEKILGDLSSGADPNADAVRENAAAAEAEKLSDDA